MALAKRAVLTRALGLAEDRACLVAKIALQVRRTLCWRRRRRRRGRRLAEPTGPAFAICAVLGAMTRLAKLGAALVGEIARQI